MRVIHTLIDRAYSAFFDPGQDAVFAGFQARGVVTNPKEGEALHMFFSPTRIPSGLTDEEARLCMALYEQRKQQKVHDAERCGGRYSVAVPTYLPAELMPTGRMTRKRFIIGIRKFIEESAASAATA
jgi:hypothetical protein